MAIEKQFQPLIEEFQPLTRLPMDMPSTLTYLEEGISWLSEHYRKEGSYNLHVNELRRMDDTKDYLLNNLMYDQYASALVTVLWDGMDYTWEEMMEITLDEPGQLLSEAAVYGYRL